MNQGEKKPFRDCIWFEYTDVLQARNLFVGCRSIILQLGKGIMPCWYHEQ